MTAATLLSELDCPADYQGGWVDDTACHDPECCSWRRCESCGGASRVWTGTLPKITGGGLPSLAASGRPEVRTGAA